MFLRFLSCIYIVFSSNGYSQITLQFSDIIEIAGKKPLEVQEKKSDLERSTNELKEAGSNFWPTVGLKATAGTFVDTKISNEDETIPTEPRGRNAYSLGMNMTYGILNSYFLTSKTMDLRASQRDLQESAYQLAKIKSVRKSAQIYLEVLRIQGSLKSEQELLKVKIKQKKDIDLKFKQGRSTAYDQTIIKIDINRQKASIATQKAQLKRAKFELIKYLGLDLSSEASFPIDINNLYELFLKTSVPMLSESFERGLSHSPTIVESERRLKVKVAERLVNKGAHVPTLNLVVSADSSSSTANNLSSDDSLSYGANLELNIALFSGLRSLHEDRSDRLAITSSRYTYERTKRDLLLNLRKAYELFEHAQIDLKDAKTNLELTKLALNQATRLYNLGRKDLSDVLKSYESVINEEKRVINAQYDYIINRFEVNLITGEIDV